MSLLPIALVEDEAILREELCFQLGHLGFAVEGFPDAASFYRWLAVRAFAAVILDIRLEGEDGLAICRYLREHDNQIGIVFVTARALRDDRLNGLHAGADAYLTKPVDIDELALILRRLLARHAPPAIASVPGGSAAWQLEDGSDCLRLPSGARVRLTVNELRLLRVLMEKPGEVAVTQELALALGLLPEEFDKHRVEVIISRLRDKVLRETGVALPVLTRRGQGYCFSIGR